MRRVAIVLFNLGGPDRLEAVRPFLKNLFSDPAIISAPDFIRGPLAGFIAKRREKLAKENYAALGGASPLLFETQAQAVTLQNILNTREVDAEICTFVAMRYWNPLIAETAAQVRDWGADEVVLLPLYPQYSSTTTGSALDEWRRHWRGPTRTLCCYPGGEKFASAHADAILAAWREADSPENPRVLFSAHGLPQRVIDRGDPYAWQVQRSVTAVRRMLPSGWDSVTCYQSRVGPLKWIGPHTDAEIRRAGAEQRGVIVAPIAFVSEHVETLIELDRDYANLAKEAGVPFYIRARALGVADKFLSALADQVVTLLGAPPGCYSENGQRICPLNYKQCPHAGPDPRELAPRVAVKAPAP